MFAPRGPYPQSTYICRVQSCVWRLQIYWPPTPLSTQRVCPPPAPKAGGTHSPGGGGGGVNILEDARHWIGLLQYNLSMPLPLPHHLDMRYTKNIESYLVNLSGFFLVEFFDLFL